MSSLSDFLGEIGRHQLLTPEKELTMGRKVQEMVVLINRCKTAGGKGPECEFSATEKICSVAFFLVSKSRPSLNLTEISINPFSGLLSAMEKCSQQIARTLIPLIGNTLVSIPAILSLLQNSPISILVSKLDEYSIEKWGIF